MKGWGKRFWLMALWPILVILWGAVPAGAVAVVSLQPSVSTPGVGSSFDVLVEISSVTDLYAYQFEIRFNPAVLAGLSVSEGTFLTGGAPTFFIPGPIDNVVGSIQPTGNMLFGALGGIDGSCTLAVIQFQALAVGSGAIDLLNVKLLDSSVVDIPFISEGGTINAVAETSAMFILGPSLVILMGLREKVRKRFSLYL